MAKAAKTSKKNTNTQENEPKNTEPALIELFIDEIKDIYWAEKHLTKALPKMKKAASSEELANAIGEHLEVTKTHVGRLEQVFELLGKKAQAKKCEAMEGLVKEGEGIIEDTEDGSATRDVGIILAAQKVEHYEIATKKYTAVNSSKEAIRYIRVTAHPPAALPVWRYNEKKKAMIACDEVYVQ